MRGAALLLALLLSAGVKEEDFALENGLRVSLLPAPGGARIALVVLYDLGERSDPAGRSGLAHLCEHLYVTAGAGSFPARTVDAWFSAYPAPSGVNAQTGDEYTVLATVFPPERLGDELAEAAARMAGVAPTEAILAREKGRLIEELANMHGRFPPLAARNLAREAVLPSPQGARKGGVAEQVEAITLEEARARLAAYYRPRNARLLLAGPLPEDARARVEAAFAPIPAGEPAPAACARGPAHEGWSTRVKTGAPGTMAAACLAFRMPEPEDKAFPAALVLAAQGMMGSPRPAVEIAALDEPGVLRVGGTDASAEELRALAARALAPPADPAALGRIAIRLLAFPGEYAAMNPYGYAFSRGRLRQMGIDPDALRRRIEALTREDLEAARDAWFGPERGAIAIVEAEK